MGLGKKFMQDPDLRNIRNTFLPLCERKVLSINNIISCLQHGFMRMSKLPPEIADRVQEELNRIKQTNSKENGGAQ